MKEVKQLRAHCQEKMKKFEGTVAYEDMRKFLNNNVGCEAGLRQILEGVQTYCQAMQADHGYYAGDDGYCGPYVEEILHGVRGLLSGPGRFDGGTVDSFICDFAEHYKLEIE